ncbi:hypothetical protein HYT05_03250, partial [Candidatus Kaiserbacteria bacterium]|nr:hypothetical protein [Candidatus Kaiserbacteria bacterium]
ADLKAGRVPDSLKDEWRDFCRGGKGLDANLHLRARPYQYWYKFLVWVPFWWASMIKVGLKKFPKIIEFFHDAFEWVVERIKNILDFFWQILVKYYDNKSKKVYAKKLDKSVYDE